MTNLESILKSRDITLPTKVLLVKAMVFPVVMYGCESWTLKKVECQRIDAFELWWWRRLLRVPWTARRSNQWIKKGRINLKRRLKRNSQRRRRKSGECFICEYLKERKVNEYNRAMRSSNLKLAIVMQSQSSERADNGLWVTKSSIIDHRSGALMKSVSQVHWYS